MGVYRAKHLLLVPSLISLLRIPLALAFFVFVSEPRLALGVLLLGALSDVLDGWWARRHQQATPTGAVVDGITDKLFAAAVVSALVFEHRLGVWGVLALAARELLEAPLVLWWILHRTQRQARAEDPKANWLGKGATVVQFVAVSALITQRTWSWLALALCAFVGLGAAVVYWRRELATFRRGNTRG